MSRPGSRVGGDLDALGMDVGLLAGRVGVGPRFLPRHPQVNQRLARRHVLAAPRPRSPAVRLQGPEVNHTRMPKRIVEQAILGQQPHVGDAPRVRRMGRTPSSMAATVSLTSIWGSTCERDRRRPGARGAVWRDARGDRGRPTSAPRRDPPAAATSGPRYETPGGLLGRQVGGHRVFAGTDGANQQGGWGRTHGGNLLYNRSGEGGKGNSGAA